MADRLNPGDTAPAFTLPDTQGGSVSREDLAGRKAVLYFYPGAFTPGCTTEACDFRDNIASLSGAGYTVYGISADPVDKLADFAREYDLTYTLLSDEGSEVAKRFGAWGEKTVNGKDMVGVLRSTFVLDEEGAVVLGQYSVSPDGHVAQLRRDLGLDS